MIGEDDHTAVDNEPVTAEDLFGDDLFDDDNGNEQSNENAENNQDNNASTSASQTPATTTRKSRVINRLPNLNDVWLTDSRRESIRKVNSYFEKIKFRKGKGQERENLKILLQRYEYFGQNCYPKLCFKDFVEKVEGVSGKRSIKHVLQDIRNGRDIIEDPDSDDNAEPITNVDEPVPAADDLVNTAPNSPARNSPSPTPDAEPTPPPKPMTDEIREMIRKKREEALAKRQQKLNESLNQSSINAQNGDKDMNEKEDDKVGDNGQPSPKAPYVDEKEAENVSQNIESNSNKELENTESKNNQSEKEVNMDSDDDSLDGIFPEKNKHKNSPKKRKEDKLTTDNVTEKPNEVEDNMNEPSSIGKNEELTKNKDPTNEFEKNENKNKDEDDNTMDLG